MSQSAWVLWAAKHLSESNTWPGRIHIHKVLYLGSRLLELEQPFDFKIYRYGPYSFDLDHSIRDLSASDLLQQEVPDPRYGPKYSPSSDFDQHLVQSDLDLPEGDKKLLGDLAHLLGDRRSSELELIATCVWAMEDEGLNSDDQIIDRVHDLKPRYAKGEIADHLAKAKTLKTQCEKLLS